jgi:hypothetical protein
VRQSLEVCCCERRNSVFSVFKYDRTSLYWALPREVSRFGVVTILSASISALDLTLCCDPSARQNLDGRPAYERKVLLRFY